MDSSKNSDKAGPAAPFDPGWNDPPPLTFNSQQASKPRNFLNKRVAFPLSGGSSNLPSTPGNLPMPVVATPPSAPPLLPVKIVETNEMSIDRESTLKEVKSILLEFLESVSELGNKANDIRRRIGIMEEMWGSGKLNSKIQLHMKELAFALRDNQPSRADDIHRSLMVDHVSVVGTWMPGVKQLIHHCIARSELLAIDNEIIECT